MKTKRFVLVQSALLALLSTGCSDDEQTSKIITLYVSDTPCSYNNRVTGVYEGMQVRISIEENYHCRGIHDIKGFTYKEGKNYVLRVLEKTMPNSPADGSSIEDIPLKQQEVGKPTE